MLQSQLFTKTLRDAPADEVSKNAQLLIKAGFVHKEMAGVYAYLPLGLRVQEKLKQIIREEMNAIGGNEIVMTSLQSKELWEQTDRWDDQKVDVWFKTKLHAGGEVGLAWSHEEPIANMLKQYVNSYKDLPIFVYQFQTKLRNELRAKSGVMRGREFTMKDLYSFCIGEEEHETFYNQVIDAYLKVYERCGLGEDTFVTFASGGAFTQFSHEFQTITDAGEDTIYINRAKNIAINDEVYNEETLQKLGVTAADLQKVTTSEVGNIFNFGTKKSEQLDLYFTDQDGKRIPVWMGSYGIGITRLIGVIAEKFSDQNGLVWPESVAPFTVHIVPIAKEESEESFTIAKDVYTQLTQAGIECLLDDRLNQSVGAKLGDADLIGIPHRVVVSKRTLEEGNVEYKARTASEPERISTDAIVERLTNR